MTRKQTGKATRPFGRRPNSTKSKASQPTLPSPAEQAGQSSGYRGGTDDVDQGLSVTLTNKDMAHDTGVVGMWIDSRNLDLVTEVLHPRQERLVEDSGASSKPWWETLMVMIVSGSVAIAISTWAMVVEARADQCSDMSVEYVDCLDMEMQQQQLRDDVDQLRQDLEDLKAGDADRQPIDLDEVFGVDE